MAQGFLKRTTAASSTCISIRRTSRILFQRTRVSSGPRACRHANVIHSSLWAMAEFHAVLHRRFREHTASASDVRALAIRFSEHVEQGLWNLVPVSEALLRRTSALIVSAPEQIFLRTADAVHLVTAQDIGEDGVDQRSPYVEGRELLWAGGPLSLAQLGARGAPSNLSSC
jgi:hypothetical protein